MNSIPWLAGRQSWVLDFPWFMVHVLCIIVSFCDQPVCGMYAIHAADARGEFQIQRALRVSLHDSTACRIYTISVLRTGTNSKQVIGKADGHVILVVRA